MSLIKPVDAINYLENHEGVGCYIHIPFCQHICTYCDFSKVYYKKDWVDDYLTALEKEIQATKIDQKIITLYIGGGTPSSLSYEQLERLFKILEPLSLNVVEYSMEVNPESMDEDKLKLFKHYGGTRVSIGVQTFDLVILKKIGRQHDNHQVFDIITKARDIGFEDISIDLMYNLPNQTKEGIKKDLEMISQLPITHLSYYSLILEEHTMLYNDHFTGFDDKEEYQVSHLIKETLAKSRFEHYEISNYCKQGYASLHNLMYWLHLPYYGFGLGAHGYMNHLRFQNTKQLSAYLQGNHLLEKHETSLEDEMFETFMVGLRLKEGISLERFKKEYHEDVLIRYEKVIQKYLRDGMLLIEEGRLKPTEKGMDLLDFILLELLE